MLNVGFIGWRGMVGSVLMARMLSENDFQGISPLFFTTSQVGQKPPDIGVELPPLKDAYDIETLAGMDVIMTCQGGDYTKSVYEKLRSTGWNGYWVDAASTLRMSDDSVIVLDPVNRSVIESALEQGTRNFIGGNCTVSLMLMAIGGLFKAGLIEWLTSMTYQAASGAGAKNMRELASQMAAIGKASEDLLSDPASAVQEIDRRVIGAMRDSTFPVDHFGVPLAGSVIPWIDSELESGQSKEEWKGSAETNKMLNNDPPIPIDGICVRIGAMRCHCQALTIKLTKRVPLDEIESIIAESNEWVRVVANTKEETMRQLTPAAVTGKLDVPVGRIRNLNIGPAYLTLYTVGDQLLWGAAEPVRRMLNILKGRLS
ncbi:MAG: aspartate-semialdehyde dehydrogenase [Desulfobacterales bacterium]|nr:aspartate-semialdehyde dehydrogenase [Desulfobacterales bacterium]